MKTVAITGGTGMIGRRLTCLLLKKNYKVIILTRNNKNKRENENLKYVEWDIEKQILDGAALSEADYIVHLAGAGIADKRWTSERKKIICESRVNSSAFLINRLREIPNHVEAVISASAIGYYGDNRNSFHPFTEDTKPTNDFLGKTCSEWEAAVEPAQVLGKRVVYIRTGVVLSNSGGAFSEFKKSLRFRAAAIPGNGQQIYSWVHLDDLCHIYLAAIENKTMKGAYNACAPYPVPLQELVLKMAVQRFGKHFFSFNIPAFVLRLVLGEMADAALLQSAEVSSSKLLAVPFKFHYPRIGDALRSLNRKKIND